MIALPSSDPLRQVAEPCTCGGCPACAPEFFAGPVPPDTDEVSPTCALLEATADLGLASAQLRQGTVDELVAVGRAARAAARVLLAALTLAPHLVEASEVQALHRVLNEEEELLDA